MKIEIAAEAGYCYGVERSLKLAKKALEVSKRPIYTYGPIIHNRKVVESLKEKGIEQIESLDGITSGTLIIRSHGVAPKIKEEAEAKGLTVMDATCPFVKKAQKCSKKLTKEGYDLVIIGEKDHPEVIGILAHAETKAKVVDDPGQIRNLKLKDRAGVVVQTTQPLDLVKKIVGELLSVAREIKICNTICDATAKRQVAAADLARRVDLMLIVGGKESANTTRLAEICMAINPKSYHIEMANDLSLSWFAGIETVGITAGASAPNWIIEEVVEVLSGLDSMCSL
ncbi:MAG: 4-hydroxy-3-methylbut-2-enyl diphosphate reductase [Actinomycetota bacterium]|nr:4-hydroxy-3-methylbut-2-enyl diphosphate reductase [Actinomycetota bacterium]